MKRGLLALATALICACGDDGRIGLDPDSSTGCEGSETRCGAACVDVTTDRNHCGGCGMACAAGDVCTLGVCEACSDDLVECAGVCRDLQTDSEHCGACGVVCAAGSACVAGTCETPCEPAQTRCDGVCTDLATDADNCGACGNDCEADESCVLGVCEAGCAPAETECGGACVDLQTSAMHCGACDDPCDDGDTCTGGECIPPTPVAEDCSSIVVLTNGANVVDWEAERADYIEGTPSCGSEPATGPDLVFRYTADEDGPIVFTLDKPAGDSHYLVLSEAVCGTVEEDTCGTDPAGTSVEVDAVMTAGRSIFLYVRGATALPDPLTITVSRGELPCTPGEDGLLSGDTTVVSATGLPTVPRYVAVDDDPDGFVYVGGTSQLYRIPKTGGAFEDVALAAGLTTDELGYDMIVDGDDIYTVDTENAVYRISRDAGATWLLESYAPFALPDGDEFRRAHLRDGTIFLVTYETSSSVPTQIWSVGAGLGAPQIAAVETNVDGFTTCKGLAADNSFYYLACGPPTSDALVRVDRETGDLDIIENTINYASISIAVEIADPDNDGEANALYVQTGGNEAYLICSPQDPGIQFAQVFARWGSGTIGLRGMATDPVTGHLWTINTSTRDLVRIE